MSKKVKIHGMEWKVGDVIAEHIAALEEDVRQRGALELDALGKIAGLEAELAKYQWVSVDERLPELREPVLILTSYGEMATARRLDYDMEPYYGWYDWMRVEHSYGSVTHWMPIPGSEQSNE